MLLALIRLAQVLCVGSKPLENILTMICPNRSMEHRGNGVRAVAKAFLHYGEYFTPISVIKMHHEVVLFCLPKSLLVSAHSLEV